MKPGQKPGLGKIDTNEKTLFEGDGKADAQPAMDALKDRLQDLQKRLYAENRHRILVVMQAMDTGGKDGCIRDVFSGIDPQGIHVESFKRPTERELAHDFLWRVHRRTPATGQLVVFNRSHYEDIVAVRVKKLFPGDIWRRRTRHVVEFERMLAEEGTTIVKIFLHISKDEQKSRLESRLKNPEKHWKVNPDDLADRSLWADFMEAYEDVIGDTATKSAPWYVIPADRKWYRDLCVARIMVDTLETLDVEFPKINWQPGSLKIGD